MYICIYVYLQPNAAVIQFWSIENVPYMQKHEMTLFLNFSHLSHIVIVLKCEKWDIGILPHSSLNIHSGLCGAKAIIQQG